MSFGIYPVDLWERILRELPVDAALIHNHDTLADTAKDREDETVTSVRSTEAKESIRSNGG